MNITRNDFFRKLKAEFPESKTVRVGFDSSIDGVESIWISVDGSPRGTPYELDDLFQQIIEEEGQSFGDDGGGGSIHIDMEKQTTNIYSHVYYMEKSDNDALEIQFEPEVEVCDE